ncbi:MAG TPA: hypothetical protein DEG64_16505, partial [Marinobacter adhaerens]|nr:hypothetical protein [Marinobacter adhaerens]
LSALALILLPVWPQPAAAISWEELWQREDQRAPALIQDNPESAARQLEDPEWRGSALYRSGKFDSAAEAFARNQGPRASYNRGNALARAGKLEEALAAYDAALNAAPDMEDALHNRRIVEELLNQKQQNQNGNQDNNQQDSRDSQGDGSNQQQNRQDQNGNSESENPGSQGNSQQQNPENNESSSDTENQQGGQTAEQNQQQAGERGDPEQASGEQETPSGQSPAPAPISETPLTQSQEQWLRRVPDNPGGLLQRKFLQQYQQRQTPSDEGDTPW